jgi:hypothetical protein
MEESVMKNQKTIDTFTERVNQEKFRPLMTTMWKDLSVVTIITFVWYQRKNDLFLIYFKVIISKL